VDVTSLQFWARCYLPFIRLEATPPRVAGAPEVVGPCWIWTGPLDTWGYGVFWTDAEEGEYRFLFMHRWALEQVIQRPLGWHEMALHKCDVRACVNPFHMYVGDGSHNMNDRLRRGSLRNTAFARSVFDRQHG
jgi:hypothetical protein